MKRLRIHFRFSLRSLLALVFVVGVVFWYSSRAKRQWNSVNWVLKNGGDVVYDHNYDRVNSFARPRKFHTLDSPPPGPDWLRDFIGIDFLDSVVAARVGNDAENHDISLLCQLYQLERLDFFLESKCDYSQFSTLRNLVVLQMWGAPIADLKPLESMTSLRRLELVDCQVKDLSPLRNLTNLEELTIETEHSLNLAPLARLKKLNDLRINHVDVKDWEILLGLPNLKRLYIDGLNEEQMSKLKTAMPECDVY